jgi:hypothetical protein
MPKIAAQIRIAKVMSFVSSHRRVVVVLEAESFYFLLKIIALALFYETNG